MGVGGGTVAGVGAAAKDEVGAKAEGDNVCGAGVWGLSLGGDWGPPVGV